MLEYIQFDEGRIRTTSSYTTFLLADEIQYEYYLKDHLGNVRMVVEKDEATGELIVSQENHYSPYGLKLEGYINNTSIASNPNPYGFGGSEIESALNTWHLHYRMYDPAIGMFWQVDPAKHAYNMIGQYSWPFNDPANFTDPLGAEGEGCNDISSWQLYGDILEITGTSSGSFVSPMTYDDVLSYIEGEDLNHVQEEINLNNVYASNEGGEQNLWNNVNASNEELQEKKEITLLINTGHNKRFFREVLNKKIWKSVHNTDQKSFSEIKTEVEQIKKHYEIKDVLILDHGSLVENEDPNSKEFGSKVKFGKDFPVTTNSVESMDKFAHFINDLNYKGRCVLASCFSKRLGEELSTRINGKFFAPGVVDLLVLTTGEEKASFIRGGEWEYGKVFPFRFYNYGQKTFKKGDQEYVIRGEIELRSNGIKFTTNPIKVKKENDDK